MSGEIVIAVRGASAQDLFFVEREVPGTQVIEEASEDRKTKFGMPGIAEAVILVGAVSAAIGVILHIAKTRKSGEIIIKRRSSPDGKTTDEIRVTFSEEEAPEVLLNKLDEMLGAFTKILKVPGLPDV